MCQLLGKKHVRLNCTLVLIKPKWTAYMFVVGGNALGRLLDFKRFFQRFRNHYSPKWKKNFWSNYKKLAVVVFHQAYNHWKKCLSRRRWFVIHSENVATLLLITLIVLSCHMITSGSMPLLQRIWRHKWFIDVYFFYCIDYVGITMPIYLMQYPWMSTVYHFSLIHCYSSF